MNTQLIQLKLIRRNLIQCLDSYSLKELNYIPKGYKNNIFWNVAHCLATQQLLHYYLSNNELKIAHFWIENFKKGTVAHSNYSQEQLEDLKDLLLHTPNKLFTDLERNKFRNYKEYMTSFGFELKNIEDAISFNNVHESIHLGYCLSIKNNF